ncbi:KAP family P-loop NTPase fold protein [Pseudomonas kurunegalensis]|uniref:KAP family NTPase n=1 Tax=Pseudomonas kurunegalensis TaxID=485880 RepID=A0ACC5UQ98_9PSED|nr:P-loop NTPase fold protein [Pseudomonas kurunegalensis]MBV4516625.1 KAP family NTPase [Pseudomonas kurunegalensis]
MNHDDLQFAQDRPIAQQKDDRLDRADFAQRLAWAVSSWKNQESLVIGLTGSWGSGKSSIKNMTLEQLASIQGCQVIEFNPWQWAGQEKLSSAFFEEVSRAVQRQDSSKDDKQLAKLLRRYEHRLNAGVSVLTHTAKWAPILLGSAMVTTALASIAQDTVAQVTIWTLSAVSWLGSIAPWLKQGAEWCLQKANILDQQAKDNEMTLQQIRVELQQLLSKRQQPLLIVLDDLDRLSTEQLKDMFQLVKAHMDFANVVFLLLFQRDTVEQGLARAGFDGADYLEKIIQVPFSVPAISTSQLEEILLSRLNDILGREPQLQQRFDRAYWFQIFQHGMRPFFGNLRHVYRYASTLAFHCRLLRGIEVAEINAVDLFALECLRMFAPETYAAMPRYKILLTGSEPYAQEEEAQRNRIIEVIDQLVNLAPDVHQPATRQLLQEMFPTLDWVFTETRYDQPIQLRWLIDSRVCCKDVFDRYFELSIPTQELPNSLLHELARRITEPEGFASLLCTFEEHQQAEILQRLLGLVNEFPLDQSPAVVQSLLRAGERVGRRSSHTHWSPRERAVRLLRLFLKRHARESTRSQLVVEAFLAVPSLPVTDQLLAGDYALRRRGDIGMFDDAGLEQLKNLYLGTVRQAAGADPGAFLGDEDLSSYLTDLNRYSTGGDEGRAWVELHVNSPSRFLQFARGFTTSLSSSTGGNTTHTAYISPSTLDYVMGISRCADWVKRLESMVLDDAESETLSLVKEALSRHAQSEAAVQE